MSPLQRLRKFEEIKAAELDAIRRVISMLEAYEPNSASTKKPVAQHQRSVGSTNRILLMLRAAKKPVNATDIAQKLSMNKLLVYPLISNLRKRKLVENAEDDGYLAIRKKE